MKAFNLYNSQAQNPRSPGNKTLNPPKKPQTSCTAEDIFVRLELFS
jgi:hypothetical protein